MFDVLNLSRVDPDCLGYPFDILAQKYGAGVVMDLADLCRGSSIYVPSPYCIFKAAIDAQIREEYEKGYSVPRLASRYGLCERTIRKILK